MHYQDQYFSAVTLIEYARTVKAADLTTRIHLRQFWQDEGYEITSLEYIEEQLNDNH